MGKNTPADNTKDTRASQKKDEFEVGDPEVHRGHSGLLVDGMKKIKSESLHKIMSLVESSVGDTGIAVDDGLLSMPISDHVSNIVESLMDHGVWLAYNNIDTNNVYFDVWVDNTILSEDREGSNLERQVGAELEQLEDEMVVDDELIHLIRFLRKGILEGAESDTPLTVGKLNAVLKAAEHVVLPHRGPGAPTHPGQGLGGRGGARSGPRGG